MAKPDYRGAGIVNLMASVVRARGGESIYPDLELLPAKELRDSRNLVLMVIDGLGYDYLLCSQAGETLRRYLRGGITSVFPTTTATAVTSFLTGTAPQQHGITGWFTYLKEIGRVSVVLPFLDRESGLSLQASGYEVAALLGNTPIFDLIDTPSWLVTPSAIAQSPYNTAHRGRAALAPYDTMSQFFEAISATLAEGDGARYVYAYWPHLDGLAHEQGIEGEATAMHLAELDRAFGSFVDELTSDTTVVVCADHGIIDSPPHRHIELAAHPALGKTLALPLCGEQRVAFCYPRPFKRRQFRDYALGELGACAELMHSSNLIAEGYFGLGSPHPGLKDRVGEYALVMKGNHTIKDWLPRERPFRFIGAHGGLSDAEMFVPLIVVQR